MRASAGTIAIVALLLAALALTSALTYEAVSAERARRATVQNALRGYASVIADDLARRTVFELESFVSLPLRRAAINHIIEHGDAPSLDFLRTKGLDQQVAVVDRAFVVDFARKSVSPPMPEPLQSWLLLHFEATVRKRVAEKNTPTLRVRLQDVDYYIIYGVGLLDEGKLFGFTFPERSIGVLMARAFARRSVFPGALGSGTLTNQHVFIRMSRDDRELFRTAIRFETDARSVMTIPASYGDAIGGLRAESAIAPAAVPAMILGGMPPSRVPLLIVTMLTNVGVLVGAFFVLRRERHLAQVRADFVSGVSHELRTPLTQIRMFSETLLFDRVRSDDERQHSLQVINEEARRLENLVDNVLFMSRGSNSMFELYKRDCDLGMTISDAIDAFTPLAIRRDVVVTADLPARLHAFVDAEAWTHVVTNILDNAVKYGPEGQTVRVSATARNGSVRMRIDDEGPGIPAGDRERVWERFQRLDRDRGSHRTGSGLGLAIVREIVRLHGGRCWVEDGPGGGARFVVEVPVTRENRA